MRLKSRIWVQAFLRQQQAAGRFGAVLRAGSDEAGAIYVTVNHLDGTCHVFGPAAGASIDEEGERRWQVDVAPPSGEAEARAFFDKRLRFDPDIWLVEVEDRSGTAGLRAANS